MAGKFELKKNDGAKFMFNLKASNGRIILTSQLYRTKAAAQVGIESVRQHAADTANFERKTSATGEPYFVLKAANRQIIRYQRNVQCCGVDGEGHCFGPGACARSRCL